MFANCGRAACLLIGFWFAGPANAQDTGPITSDNWTNHPEIRQIRDLYNTVTAALDSGELARSVRRFTYCRSYEDTERVSYSDANGTVRHYHRAAGSDDSTLRWNYYYDEVGQLRFVFIEGGAVNGTLIEHRLYFGGDGTRLWEVQRLVEGPGYTFPHIWPDADMVRDPRGARASGSPCEELLE